MSQTVIRLLSHEELVALPTDLAQAVGFTGLDAWMKFVQTFYGFPLYRIVAQTGGEITGWLALVRVKHPAFGDYLVTSPFGSYGGFTYTSHEARDGLLDQAQALANELGVEHVNIRFEEGGETPPAGWVQHPIYATYRVDLAPDPNTLLSAYSSDHRNHIRKSMKKGFSIRFGHLDLFTDAYEGLARSMHELGSPYHNQKYLRGLAHALSDDLEFAVLYDAQGELVGSGVFIFQGETVTNLHANILRRARSDYAGEFLYWSLVERYCQKGLKVFDLGRSLIGSGNETFKSKWKPRKVPLAYWYYLPQGGPIPELNQKSPKFQFAIWLWQRLPAFVVRALGPGLIRGIA